jgi:hypothetical protein
MKPPSLVPWVALWTSESDSMKSIAIAPYGVMGERDSQGIYWVEYGNSPRVGNPLFGCVHTRRQVESMKTPKCQVCGEKLSHPFYWILNKLDSQLLNKKTIFTQTPPVCEKCIPVAITECPHLISMGKDVPVVKVSQYSCIGAYGDLILPGIGARKHTVVKYGSDLLPFFCGRQMIVELQTWKRIPLDRFGL